MINWTQLKPIIGLAPVDGITDPHSANWLINIVNRMFSLPRFTQLKDYSGVTGLSNAFTA